jgi:hypothetical protein
MTTKIYMMLVSAIFAIGLLLPNFPTLANPSITVPQTKPALISLTGIIHKLPIEGTCYQLAADNGQNYELMGKFPKKDGIKVRVQGTILKDVATICQVGQPFQVKSVRVVR